MVSDILCKRLLAIKYLGRVDMKKIKIHKNPLDLNYDLFSKSTIQLKEGVTVLVGCNGYGKSTMLKCIKNYLNNENIDYIFYDNLFDGGLNAKSEAGFYGKMDLLASMACSSEGENIVINMGTQAARIGSWVRKHPEYDEYFILFDAIDSGLSIDNIVDVKEYLFKTILDDNKDKKIYIIVSANSYEMCAGENCFDVNECKYIKFKDYNEYREYILGTKQIKEDREDNAACDEMKG